MGPLQFCLPVFLRIHRNPKRKEFSNSYEGFLMAGTNRARPSQPTLKNCQKCMKFDFFLAQMPSFKELWKCHFMIMCIRLCPSANIQVIKWDKWDYFNNPSEDLKKYSCLGFLWIPIKTGSPIFKVSIW